MTIDELDEGVRAELVEALVKATQIIDHYTLQDIRLVTREDGTKYWEPLNRAAKAFDAIEALIWELT